MSVEKQKGGLWNMEQMLQYSPRERPNFLKIFHYKIENVVLKGSIYLVVILDHWSF